MDPLDWLKSRRSSKIFGDGDVSEQAVRRILHFATGAPDHGLLRPWRFVVFRGAGRDRFGEALVEAARGRDANLDIGKAERLHAKALIAPVFIALVASPKPSPKVERWEQLASAASVGYALLLGAHALDLAAMWKSTPLRDEPAVRRVLSLTPDEEFLGWVNLGQPLGPDAGTVPPKPPVDLAELVTEVVN